MRKEKIAEALFVILCLLFLAICIMRTEKNNKAVPVFQQKETVGTSTLSPTITGGAVGTGVPLKAPTPELFLTPTPTPTSVLTPTFTPEPTETLVPTLGVPEKSEIKNENYESFDNKTYAWWFKRKEDHSPSGSGEAFAIAPFDAYYRNTEVTDGDKVVYLTFDCGYENGYTPSILDTLAENNVKAMFFVTKDFIVKNPEYVKRMKEEGHLVGNHTVRHLSTPELSPEELEAELEEVAKTMYERTGYEIDPYFRPPMGEYSERTLQVTKDIGYASVFWSIAYYDYDTNDQPGKEYVVDHFKTYHHNGTIILMHNTSSSNAEALQDVIELLKAEGYRFGSLTELTGR